MTRCQQARRWLADADAKALTGPDRLRLEEHLQQCPRCTQEAQLLGRLVGLLRDDVAEPDRGRLERVLQRALREQRPTAPQPRRRWWIPAAALSAAVAIAVLLFVAFDVLRAPPAPDEPPLPTKTLAKKKKATSPRPARRSPAPERTWRLLTGTEVLADRQPLEAPPRAGQLLETGRGGRAVFASSQELLLLSEQTKLRLATDGRSLRLLEGTVAVQTRSGLLVGGVAGAAGSRKRAELRIHVGELVVQPVGTLFAVHWRPGEQPEVSVLEGRVLLRGGQRRVEVAAGQTLRWGAAPQAISAAVRRQLAALAGLQRSGATPKPAPATQKVAKRSPIAVSLPDRLRSLQLQLANGKTAQVRRQARALLTTAQVEYRPQLRTLIAEAHASDRAYLRAWQAYRDVHRHHPRHALGAHGLYMAASLALDQLRRQIDAERDFERYLARYPGGRQREGARFMLCKALLAQGKNAAARQSARAYQHEFPRGRYRRELSQLLSR